MALSDGRPHSNPTRERGDRLSVRNCPRPASLAHGREFSLSLIRSGFGKKVGLVTRPRYTTYRRQESQHRGARLVIKTRYGDTCRHIHTLFNVGTVGGLTDGQLLERFTTGTGEAAELAFAALVERHGPMVLRVCQSVVRAAARCPGRFSGDVPGPGPQGQFDPQPGLVGQLAARSGLPHRGLCQSGHGPATKARAKGGRAGNDIR